MLNIWKDDEYLNGVLVLWLLEKSAVAAHIVKPA
jgi:hypothetical protein